MQALPTFWPPAVQAQGANVRWRMASSFPKSLDTIYGSGEMFAKTVKSLSDGKFEVMEHAAGELMPTFGVVDGVQNGTVEMDVWMEVFAVHEAMSPEFKKIHQDMREFQRNQLLWLRFSELRFDNYLATVKL